MQLFLTWTITLMITATVFFILGQDNPLPVPIGNQAEIYCPMPAEYTIQRNMAGSVKISCE